MGNRKKIVENIKNVLIAVLFISAVLLLSFFWKDISLEDISNFTWSFQSEDEYIPELSELTRPGQIEVCFGSDVYTVISADWGLSAHGVSVDTAERSEADDDTDEASDDGIYEYMCSIMEKYLSQDDVTHEKIEKSQYNEVMEYPSLTAVFSFDIPFVDFLNNNGMDTPQDSDTISNVTRISFSTASSENLFIYDASADEYYRFVTQDEEFADSMSAELATVINAVEDSEPTAYYSIENLAGIENEALIPVYQSDDTGSVQCSSEFLIEDDASVRRYEQMFFPSGLDFIRKITENKGSLIYTYGYNQKVLLLDETGRISYTEELDAAQYSDTGFYDGLEKAVQYVGSHGGWSSAKTGKMVPYLSNVSRVTSDDGKYKGFKYEFSVRYKGTPVFFSSGAMLSVEIYGSQITSYQRDLVALSQLDDSAGTEVINAIDVITEEYEEIAQILAAAAEDSGDSDKVAMYTSGNIFENVVKNIDIIRFCMLRDIDNDPSYLVPAWYLRVDGIRFWCSPDDGHILTWSTAEVS